jgi:NAD(P)H-dependent FMN reductase
MKILAISGSTRQESTNTALLMAMKEFAPSDAEIQVFHRLDLLPVFSPDSEGEKTPPAVTRFLQLVSSADGIVISSPEYIHAIPGGLKNAIDWMVSRFEVIGKPIVLAHASHRGDDMLASLRLVLSTVSDGFLEDVFMRIPLIGQSRKEVQALLHLPEYQLQITDFLSRFLAAIHQKQTLDKEAAPSVPADHILGV